jgi:hypothetical protein
MRARRGSHPKFLETIEMTLLARKRRVISCGILLAMKGKIG